jgi:RND family efflux transporter MFP subunit
LIIAIMRDRGSYRKLLITTLLACWLCVTAEAQNIIQGITEPYRDIKLSSSVAGIIRAEFYEEGDRVEKGEVILELDMKLEELEATRREFIMTRNKTDMESTRSLFKTTRSVSREEMQEKETEFSVSEAEYGMALEQLEKRRISAPVSGSVVEILLREGEACEPYEPLVRVVDTTRFYFVGYVEAAAMAGLRLGQPVKVEVDVSGGPLRIDGTINYLSPVVDPASGLAKVKAVFSNGEGKIRPGVPGKLLLD